MPSTTPLTDAINALTTYANTTTGVSDTTLSDAVATLIAGYGGGGSGGSGGVYTGTFTPTERVSSVTIDVGTSETIDGLIIVPTSERPLKEGGKTVVAYLGITEGYYKYLCITSNNAGSSFLTPTSSLSSTCFTQTGSVLTVTPTNAGMFETVSYTWYAFSLTGGGSSGFASGNFTPSQNTYTQTIDTGLSSVTGFSLYLTDSTAQAVRTASAIIYDTVGGHAVITGSNASGSAVYSIADFRNLPDSGTKLNVDITGGVISLTSSNNSGTGYFVTSQYNWFAWGEGSGGGGGQVAFQLINSESNVDCSVKRSFSVDATNYNELYLVFRANATDGSTNITSQFGIGVGDAPSVNGNIRSYFSASSYKAYVITLHLLRLADNYWDYSYSYSQVATTSSDIVTNNLVTNNSMQGLIQNSGQYAFIHDNNTADTNKTYSFMAFGR